MPKGNVGGSKKGSNGSVWNPNYDKFIIKWWLERDDIDMGNRNSWELLKEDFYSFVRRPVSTATLQNQCVASVDPMLNLLFVGMLEPRSHFGYSEGLSLTDKLKIMNQRLLCVKKILMEGNRDLPFEVEPRRVQSKLPTYTVSFPTNTAHISTPVMGRWSTPLSSLSVSDQSSTTPQSSLPKHGRRVQRSDLFSDDKEPSLKRHKLEYEKILPMEFRSNEEGAKSIDVEGCVLPKQVFKGKTFFLLQDTSDYTGKIWYDCQMYLVELHGGKVVERRRDICLDTIFISPQSGELTDIYKNRIIYRPSLIFENAKNLLELSEETMKEHVNHDVKLEAANAVRKAVFVKQEKMADLVDLTSDDDEVLLDDGTNDALKADNDSNAPNDAEQTPKSQEGSELPVVVKPAGESEIEDLKVNEGELLEATGFPSTNTQDAISTEQTTFENGTDAEMATERLSEDDNFVNSLSRTGSEGQNNSRAWTDTEKLHAFALVFRHSLAGKSAMNICRAAADHFEAETGTKISPETIRSRVKRLGRGKHQGLFDDLKNEYKLTADMLEGFEMHFKENCEDCNESELKGLAVIDSGYDN